MGTTNKIVYGSDDDLEDDISHEYLESLPASRSTTGSVALADPEDQPYDTSREQVADAMHEAHAGLFTDSQSINITDQTAHIDLDSLMKSGSSLKRNLTTMEQLSSKRPAYSSRTSKEKDPELDEHYKPVLETLEAVEPASKKLKRLSSTPVPRSQRALKGSGSKRSGSNSFDMPSSHETHAAGSKELARDSPELFRTQTTVPFTNPTQRMLPPTQNGSPIVLIPPVESNGTGNLTQRSVGNVEPGSSAVLEAQIDGIGDWLQDDIAHAQQEQEAARQGLYLPTPDPESVQLPPPDEYDAEESQGSVNPQDLMLDPKRDNYPASSVKSSQDPLADSRVEQDTSYDNTRLLERVPVPNIEFEMSKPTHKSVQADDMDELEAGLPPPEMYKPRPSKSRGRRATADPDVLPSSIKVLDMSRKRKGKRSRTMGDASTPIEILDDSVDAIRPTKKLKKEAKPETESRLHVRTEIDITEVETTPGGQLRQNTIELGDAINEAEAEPEYEPEKPAPQPKKKKRGRPSKAEKQRQAAEQARQAEADRKSHDEMAEEPTAPSVEPLTDPEEDQVMPMKKRKFQKQSLIGDSDNDSEDELASRVQRKKPTTQPTVEVKEGPDLEDPPELVKKPAKRGRKPKTKPKSVEVIVDEAEEVDADAAAETVKKLEGAESGEAEPEAARMPLQDKPDSQNQKLQVLIPHRDAEDETRNQPKLPEQNKAAAPETPQAQKGSTAGRPSPFTTGTVRYRVGLSRRSRIEPLLKTLKR